MISYISLFSGCGGFDRGFSDYFDCIGAYDIDDSAIATYKANFESPIYKHDLNDTNLPNVDHVRAADLILAGSPCQGFSTVGKRCYDDPRNELLYTAVTMAKIVSPKVVICENVPAVKSGKQRQYWDKLVEGFHALGYNTEEFLYDFSNHGLAQIRKRIFLIAYTGPKVSRSLLSLPDSSRLNLREVISGVETLDDHVFSELKNDIDLEIARNIKPGQKLSNVRAGPSAVHSWDIPSAFGCVSESEKTLLRSFISLRRRFRTRENGDADPVTIRTLEQEYPHPYKRDLKSLIKKNYIVCKDSDSFDLVGTFNGKYRRLRADGPSHTVDTNFGNARYFIHPSENRGFSIREAARIQGFPDDFVFRGGVAQKYRMIGNAVPPLIANRLALSVKKVFFK